LRDPALVHDCYACRTVFARDAGAVTARFPGRFQGPPGSVNGGIAVGSLTCPALRALSDDGLTFPFAIGGNARLRAPIPLERELVVVTGPPSRETEVALLLDGTSVIAGHVSAAAIGRQVNVGTVLYEALDREPMHPGANLGALQELSRVDVPDAPPFFEELGQHSVPGCFSCGPEALEGMHLYPRFAGDGLVCAPWKPSPEFDDGNGAISPMIVASALDCSSGICLPRAMQQELIEEDRFFLLGSLNAVYLRLPPVGEAYRVVGRALRRDGRKFLGLSALFDDAGTPYAYAEATWVVAGVTRTEAFGAHPRP
jgi:hypothetical protein